MSFVAGNIDGVIIKDLPLNGDARGVLIELYRCDELPVFFSPVMAYASWTLPQVQRGPHEHKHQTDCFCFLTGRFHVYLWDARAASVTKNHTMCIEAGQSTPKMVIVPPGVVHAYKNVDVQTGLVINSPNALYKGYLREQPVDEIRHELDPDTPYTTYAWEEVYGNQCR